jgi:hypothetical protein
MDDNRKCVNQACSIRMSCARANDEDFDGPPYDYYNGQPTETGCSAFILRKALGRGDPDMVFTEARRRGRRHNAHAYSGPRTSFPGTEALFGAKLAKALGAKKHPRSREDIPRRPDLMVTRHLRDGRNIKED